MTEFAVPTVRIILENLEGKILLLRRSNKDDYGKGKYCLPGGKVYHGKTVEDTCIEEAMEETGLNVSNLKFLFYKENLPKEAGMKHILELYFQADYSGSVRLNDESSAHRWVSPNQLYKYKFAFENDKAIKEYVKRKRYDL